MISRINTHRQLLAITVGILAFILTGCRTDMTYEVHADGSIKSTIIAEDTDDSMRKIKQDCEDLQIRMRPISQLYEKGTMEDITPPGVHGKCRFTSNEQGVNGIKIQDRGSTYEFILKPAKEKKFPGNGIDAVTTIVMPGKVIETNAGRIEDNKVIIDNLDYPVTGISITAQKGEGASGSPPSRKAKGASGTVGAGSSSSHDESGFPWWGWAGIGAGLIAAVGGAAIVAERRKRATAPHPIGSMPN